MTVFNQAVDATGTTSTSVSTSVTYHVTVSGGSLYWAFGSTAASVQRYVPITQTMNLGLHNNTPTKAFTAGGVATSGVKFSSTFGTKQILRQALAQVLGVVGTPRNAIPISVAVQHLGVHNAVTTKIGVLIAQYLAVHDARTAVAKLKQSLADHFGAHGTPLPFAAKAIHEALGIAMAVSPKLTAIASRSGGSVGVHNIAPTVQKFAVASIRGNLQFNQTLSAKQILRALIQEVIDLEIALVDPTGDVTTWVVNTRTGAISEYGNYNFNSFAQNGLHYMGASDAGLFVLDGDDDDGAPVLARLRSGYAQFGGSRYTSLRAVYIGARGEGDLLFKIDTGDGRLTTYKARLQDMESTKVLVGKGVRSRYIAFEILSEGQDFDLDTVEFVPAVAQRRV
jgi:hypothetical protein